MKALKEKRISLRSLWRRGLVILSLFALVFASCSDSSGGVSESSGPRVVRYSIKTGPTNDQYMGQEVDLTGMVLEVYLNDGNRKDYAWEDYKSRIKTNPRVVTGWYYDKDSVWFNPATYYDVTFDGLLASEPLQFGVPGKPDVYPIVTDLFVSKLYWGYDEEDDEYWYGRYLRNWAMGMDNGRTVGDLGLHLTGSANMKQKTAYVDDDTFDFAGLTLEADYLTNLKKLKEIIPLIKKPQLDNNVWVPKVERKPVSFSNVTWEIRPRYEEGVRPAGESFDGYVFVTVGQDTRYERNGDWWAGYTEGVGVTTLVPLEKVYSVRDRDALRLIVDADKQKEIETYFYWQENTKGWWVDRLGADAQLEITYSNGDIKTKYIKDLAEKARIYLNADPQEGRTDWWTEEGVYQGPADFDIMTLKYPFTKKSTDLGIRLYYRGAVLPIPVNVYTVLLRVNAEPEVEFWPNPKWDNDVDNGKGGPSELAKKLNVTATYRAINNAELTIDIPLKYWWDEKENEWPWPVSYTEDGKTKASGGVFRSGWGTGPYFVFGADDATKDEYWADYLIEESDPDDPENSSLIATDVRENGDTYTGDSTYVKGYQKFLTNSAKGKATTTKVTVRHFVSVEEIAGQYNDKFRTRFYNYWNSHWDERPDNWTVWVSPSAGMLPNGYHYYDPQVTKGPFKDDENGRNFGPKVNQSKKAKISVKWING